MCRTWRQRSSASVPWRCPWMSFTLCDYRTPPDLIEFPCHSTPRQHVNNLCLLWFVVHIQGSKPSNTSSDVHLSRSAITPGTTFMCDVSLSLMYFVCRWEALTLIACVDLLYAIDLSLSLYRYHARQVVQDLIATRSISQIVQHFFKNCLWKGHD